MKCYNVSVIIPKTYDTKDPLKKENSTNVTLDIIKSANTKNSRYHKKYLCR